MIKAFKISQLKNWRFKISQSIDKAIPFNDWYLGSLDEMQEVNDELFLYDVGNLSGEYWTSSEVDSSQAYSIDFESDQQNETSKSEELKIRPVRHFTAEAGEYDLRDTGQSGGLIYHIDGTTYYECALEDLTQSEWSEILEEIGTTGTAIGTGKQNTLDIINQQPTPEPEGIGTMIIESTFIIS